ncbi:MAG TPA: carbonic anhydrase [Patescibacteria group bacterium]|nr:carbonic anhydrase [Patescibacteria group bacterium]
MHKFKALLINCMDPRLQGDNEIKIAAAAGLKPGEYEVLAYAGPSLWMTDPHLPADADMFWNLLDKVSLKVHGISQIVIVGHSSCGGFALKGAPQEPEAEKAAIVGSLLAAADAIRSRQPQLEVILQFVKIDLQPAGGLPEIKVEPIEVPVAV